MPKELEAKVRTAIERGLKEAQADLETLPNGHVSGHVIAAEFVGLDYEERRTRVNEVLSKELASNELLQVSTLLTYTPDEWSVATSDLNL